MVDREPLEDRIINGSKSASHAVVDAFLLELGTDLARLSRHTGWARHTRTWVYSLQIKYPRTPLGAHVAIVKGICEGEFLVGFHSNDGLGPTLSGLGRRLENGTLEWKEDEFPPHKADEILKEWDKLTTYYRD